MKSMNTHLEEITVSEAPHLHKTLEELCLKAGIKKPQLCKPSAALLRSGHAGMIFIFDHLAGAFHLDHPRIVLGDSAREIFGHPNLAAEVSEQLKAVLAHELSHLKHGDVRLHKIIPLRISPFIGLAAGIAGLAIYNHIKKSEPKTGSDEDKKHELNHQLDTEIKKIQTESPWLGGAITVMKYTAAGALGLIAGSIVCKLLHNRMEFRADQFSAELMGSGKPLAEALTAFKNYAEKMAPKKVNPVDKYIEWILHPDINQRITRLNAI